MAYVARTLNAAVYTVRREAFVEAAQRLMESKGYAQVTIQDLLDDVGASRGAFYHYFDSKQALLEAVIDRMVDAGLASVEPIVQDPNLPAVTKLGHMFSGIGRWKTDRKELILAFIDVWLSDDHAVVREKFRRKLVTRFVPTLSGIVKQGIEEGTFRVASPDDTARVLMMLIQGLQEEATELFVASQANAVGLDEVIARFASFEGAFERVLGVETGSISLVDQSILRAWYGNGIRRPHVVDHRS
jgi:AcrR family transcriptional regulator